MQGLVLRYRLLKSWFTCPLSCLVFREKGPRLIRKSPPLPHPPDFAFILSLFPVGLLYTPGTLFSKVPKSFRGRKAITQISNLKFTELFFSHIFNMNKGSLHAKFYAHKVLLFKTRSIKNGFAGPKSFRDFRETSPGRLTYTGTPLSSLDREMS